MSKIVTFFARKTMATAVALALSLGALSPAAAYDYSGYRAIASHQYWHSFAVQVDGTPSAGVATTLGKERMAAVLLVNRRVNLVLSAKPWNLNANDEIGVTVTFKDKQFMLKAHAVSERELALDIQQDEFIKRLTHADALTIQVKGETWTVNLEGFDESISEALNVVKKTDASF